MRPNHLYRLRAHTVCPYENCMNIKKIHKILFFFLFLLSTTTQAQLLPLRDMTLRLVPQSTKKSLPGIGPKTVEIKVTNKGIRVQWFSIVKERILDQDYPTYKVRAAKGGLFVHDLFSKFGFFHPQLWGNGFINLHERLPLWVSPEILSLEGRKEQNFDLGLLNLNPLILKAVPDTLYENLLYFQNMFDYYTKDGEVNGDAKMSRSKAREVKKFLEEFFKVGVLAQTQAKLKVGKTIQNFKAKIVGNRYFQMVVLDDTKNPMVVSFRISADKAPKVFEKNFEFLKNNFEFQVTQVLYE